MYRYRAAWKRSAAGLADRAGRAVFRRKRAPAPAAPRRILVIRLDHIGDQAFAEPFLRELKKARPQSEIIFLTSPAGRELFGSAPFVDRMETYTAPWFDRQSGFMETLRAWPRLVRLVALANPDVVVDLRGDCRHILAARRAAPRAWIVSNGTTGCGFLLDREVPYRDRAHEPERNMDMLEAMGIPNTWGKVMPGAALAAAPVGKEASARIPPRSGKWIAVHPSTGTHAKEWPLGFWAEFLKLFEKKPDCKFFWIGDRWAAKNAERIQEMLGEAGSVRFVQLAGVLPLAQLGSFLECCDLLVTPDSGPAHVAAGHGVRTIVLFSGTNEVHEWKPMGDRASVLFHEVMCSPCHLTVCPQKSHYCMEGIRPEAVYREAEKILEGRYDRNRD